MNCYEYFLKSKTDGTVIELGSAAELSDEDRLKHNIEHLENWEFGFREVKE